jgi:hypothetical protein
MGHRIQPHPGATTNESVIGSKMEVKSSFGFSEEPVSGVQLSPSVSGSLIIITSPNHLTIIY